MNLPTYKLKNLITSAKDLRGQLILIFWFVFLLLLFFQVSIIKTSVKHVLNPGGIITEVKTSQGVRINFKNYDEVVAKIERAEEFETSPRVNKNPFFRSR
jgi:hypothetical protein